MQDEDWAKATAPYGDYVGTTAADRWSVDGKGFRAIPGLDHDRYKVMGVSLSATEHGSSVHLALLDKQKYGDKPLSQVIHENGGIPITDMQLHGYTIDSFLQLVMNQSEFTLVDKWLKDETMNVVERTDLPPQN